MRERQREKKIYCKSNKIQVTAIFNFSKKRRRLTAAKINFAKDKKRAKNEKKKPV